MDNDRGRWEEGITVLAVLATLVALLAWSVF
jgi:hypothetical protein